MAKITSAKISGAFANILKLFSCLTRRRKLQICLLFVMQTVSASLEVVSIGSIVPFLSALTDVKKLMTNHYIALLSGWAQVTDPQQLIVLLAIIFSIGVIVSNVFRFFTLLSQQYLSAAIAVDLGEMLYAKTLYKPYQYFLTNNTSQIIGNTTNDLNGTLGALYCFFSLVTQGLIAISVATGLLVYNPKIALILSVVVLVSYSIIMALVNRRLRHNSRISSDSYRDVVKFLQEGFGGIRYIIMGRLHKNFTSQFAAADKWFRRKNAENSVILQSPKFFLESVGVVAICAITITYMAHSKNISEIIPLMGFLVFGCYRLLPAVQQVYSSISAIVSLTVSLERVIEVITEPFRRDLTRTITTQLKIEKSLEFENIFFDYHGTGENWTIDNLSCSIKSKTTVALVGHTGSGKSTVSDLILGLIKPQKGNIKIDGVTLDSANMGEWQAGISHVPQTIFLSDTTIASNIAFGIPRDQIDMDRVQKSSKMAQLHEFVGTLSNGYQEEVGERGVRLSGGQRQRIGIARALYQNPSLIVFDEATSALDNKTESDVVQAINELKHDLTIILIAHRLSTIKNADNILVFEQGRLIAQGTYDELLKNAHFSELVRSAEFG